MSEPYVQTIDELRSEYVEACAEQYGFADLYAQEWDRAIAAHDREVKAAALREMADDWMYPDRISRLFQDWLRETATSIESEARP